MKKLTVFVATFLTAAFVLGSSAIAGEKAEKTVKGKAVCAHCDLGIENSCQAVIQTTQKNKQGKDVARVYYLSKNAAAKEIGRPKGQNVTIKGTVKKEGKGKDAKLILTAKKVEQK